MSDGRRGKVTEGGRNGRIGWRGEGGERAGRLKGGVPERKFYGNCYSGSEPMDSGGNLW